MSGYHVVTTNFDPHSNKRGYHAFEKATGFDIDYAGVLTLFEDEKAVAAYAPGTWQRILTAGWKEI